MEVLKSFTSTTPVQESYKSTEANDHLLSQREIL